MKLEIKKLSFPEQVKFVRMFLQLSQTELAKKNRHILCNGKPLGA